ncbi:hypothetical protein J4E85_010844 [Alternaria conjuncta]|uniref:uncharacterized protein n=1 Tax=Alternaria conjuncta TaxID=181017 RepID=UPI00221EEB7E|nr:uncharacterized protein J4E85_010844 [Alternaria conjuncta]KAI4913112.1 hypothetical protein J4E85_010844 [Alternaria conjuncta]
MVEHYLVPPQPYTASFLARLSTFILHAPLNVVESTLRLSSTDSGKPQHINPNSDALRPTQFMTTVCQGLLQFLNMGFDKADHASPDTIPLALCLLLRYRAASSSTSQREDERKYEYAISDPDASGLITTVPIPYSTSRSCYHPEMSDATLVAIAVHTAYKFLVHDWVNLEHWAVPLQLSRHALLRGERTFLRVIEYAVWVRQDEYVQMKGKLDDLWEEVFKKASRPAPPDFVMKRLKTRG